MKREIVTFDDGATDAARRRHARGAGGLERASSTRRGCCSIDTRNAFEVALGSFPGAVDPGITRFSDFRAYVDGLDPAAHPRVAMFCTGGIRCEKAGAYMRAKGFADVRHLAGRHPALPGDGAGFREPLDAATASSSTAASRSAPPWWSGPTTRPETLR